MIEFNQPETLTELIFSVMLDKEIPERNKNDAMIYARDSFLNYKPMCKLLFEDEAYRVCTTRICNEILENTLQIYLFKGDS